MRADEVGFAWDCFNVYCRYNLLELLLLSSVNICRNMARESLYLVTREGVKSIYIEHVIQYIGKL